MTQKQRSRPFIFMFVFLVVVGLLGCSGETSPGREIDLTEAFPNARVLTETDVVDFSDPSARELLGAGWVLPRLDDDTRGLAWGVGSRSEMVFFRLLPGDLKLHFWCRPSQIEGGRVQTVSFLVNGRGVGTIDLQPKMQHISIRVPVEVLRSGENALVMKYSDSLGRGRRFIKPSADRAVGWGRMKIEPTPSFDSGPEVNLTERALFIPFGARVDFFLGSLNAAEFRVEEVRRVGSCSDGRLIVSTQAGAAPETVNGELTTSSKRVGFSISANGRLSLGAMGSCTQDDEGRCGFVLTRPVVSIRDQTGPPLNPTGAVRSSQEAARRPNVILYLIDALRADHLGCYGYDRPVSPHIDRFAEHAVLFERAQAQTSWTRASVASIFTGLMPQVHSANDDDEALSERLMTIAEYLHSAGYQTAGFSSNGNAGPNVGFAQGFDEFRNLGPVRSEEINRSVFSWLDQRNEERPVFIWVHTVDPHAPYMPPGDMRDRFAADVTDPNLGSVARVESLGQHPERLSEKMIGDLLALYDAEIAANDRSFGVFLSGLEKRGVLEDSLVILLADHGEEFYDHGGWTHGKTLFAEVLNVPLIVRFPGIKEGSRIDRLVQHVDLLPTILSQAGLPVPGDIQGEDLTVLLGEAGRRLWIDRTFSSLDLRGRKGAAVIDGRWKVIRFRGRHRGSLPMLFDVGVDRRETQNLALRQPDTAATMLALESLLTTQLPEPVRAPEVDTSAKEEMRDALRALGYIE